MSPYTQKHLTLDQRDIIQQSLDNRLSMVAISSLITKDNSTISKEIKNHRHLVKPNAFTSGSISCIHHYSCTRTLVCPSHDKCHNILCKSCNLCSSFCKDFQLDICPRLKKAPHVCNGCLQFTHCKKSIKYKYIASFAQKEYEYTLKDSREGINLTLDQYKKLDNLISPLVKENKQPLSHIIASHKDEIPCCPKTIYNYIHDGNLSCKDIDLPRKVKYKPRKKHASNKVSTTLLRQSRTYQDYLQYVQDNPDSNVIQMDTVEGKKIDAGPYLLTLHCVKTNLQLAHLIPTKEKENVPLVFSLYKELLDKVDIALFPKFFAVLLTDNGIEFAGIEELEKMGCKVFFCDPNRSDQKGACERNHEYIRFILPKGVSFKGLKQKNVWNMMSHINSIKRPGLNDKSPYEVTSFLWGQELLNTLHIQNIHPDQVTLSRYMIK